MKLTRRSFIGGAFASSLLCRTYCETGDSPDLRVGILSDTHVSYPIGDSRVKPFDYRSADAFRNALFYFRDRKVDAVVIAGDMTNSGMVDELAVSANLWREVFPANRRPDGGAVEPIVIYGNHEVLSWITQTRQYKGDQKRLKELLAKSIHRDPAGEYEKAFGRRYEPIFARRVKKRLFTCVNWGFEGLFPQWLDEHRDELAIDAGCRFFHVQHPHPQETVYSDYYGVDYMLWAHVDQSLVTKALAKHPRAVAFSGHSHIPLTDPLSIWRGSFTSVATGALCGTSAPKCYEARRGEYRYAHGNHGLLMSVWPNDEVVIERLDFRSVVSLGADWRIS